MTWYTIFLSPSQLEDGDLILLSTEIKEPLVEWMAAQITGCCLPVMNDDYALLSLLLSMDQKKENTLYEINIKCR